MLRSSLLLSSLLGTLPTLFSSCGLLSSCGFPGRDEDAGASAPSPSGAANVPQVDAPAHTSREIVHVPVGKFQAGSLPGEVGRRPDYEPLARELELGPFRIDPAPYPGTPGTPARVGVSQSEAEALCAARQGRLCTELEWERACKGPSSATYPTGRQGCAPDTACASGFEVGAMTALPEWTSSHLPASGSEPGPGVVRGAAASAAVAERRCARRAPAGEIPAAEIGFRCCYGAPNALRVTEPVLGEPYREVDLSLEELANLLKSDPATAALAEKATFFRSPDGARTVLERGPRDTQGFTLTTKPLRWQPDRGLDLLVVAGRSGDKTSFVVAYHVAGDTRVLASSFVMKNEPGPVALAYAASIRPRLHFSTCWGCPGETGKLLFRAPEEFVMLQP